MIEKNPTVLHSFCRWSLAVCTIIGCNSFLSPFWFADLSPDLRHKKPGHGNSGSPRSSFFHTLGARRHSWQQNASGLVLEETADVKCNNRNCSNRMTSLFTCRPYCLHFLDNCSECIRCRYKPIIRDRKWPTASTVSQLRAESESLVNFWLPYK